MQIRGLAAALNSNQQFKFRAPEHVVDHLVIGAGVVGLAVAQRLATVYPHKTTFIIERNSRTGEETSSRNSEVIHAGLYYPVDSLKTRLCILGRRLLYEFCDVQKIPHRKTGKLVVATEAQRAYIENLHVKAQSLRWPSLLSLPSVHDTSEPALPTILLDAQEVHDLEPDLSGDITSALLSPETGILDSHALMEALEKDIIDSEGGELVRSTRVVRIDPYKSHVGVSANRDENGWVVQMVTADAREGDAVLARAVVDASGLSGPFLSNALVPERSRIPMYYARGSYASYSGPGIRNISHLIYPCPESSTKPHAFQSLGTHLTLDLQGRVRFGPDIEWISPPGVDGEEGPVMLETSIDFWKQHLVPSDAHSEEMYRSVAQYLPGVTLEGFHPDYVGIRPKLIPPGAGFQDFLVDAKYPDHYSGRNPMINLLGIESPGLTSSLAIARLVSNMIDECTRQRR